jgi:integrase
MFKKKLDRLIERFGGRRARGNGPTSLETRYKYAEVLYGGFRTLIHFLGCKIEDPGGFREYHLKKLARYWEQQGIKDLQTRISIFRIFGNVWLGKRGMIRDSKRYVENPASVRRRCATTEDKTWSGKGLHVMEMIRRVEAIDARVAMILEVMYAFGVRIKEALLLRPHVAGEKEVLVLNRGTKGGKHRISDILATVQNDVLQRAKAYAARKTSSMIPDERKFASYRRHVYRVCNKAGIARKFGLVPHGLRHEYANQRYAEITNAKSPIKGGASGDVDPELDKYARAQIAESLGHHRPRIASAYLGAIVRDSVESKDALTNLIENQEETK